MLLTIAVGLWISAVAWFLVAWAFFHIRDRRAATAPYELTLDAA